jgi:hypothetical protein
LEKNMKVINFSLLILSAFSINAHADPFLGSAWQFSVLGAATVTNTRATTLNADLGVSPGAAVTGYNTITFSGAPPNNIITSTAIAAAGQLAATAAVTAIDGLGSGTLVGNSSTGVGGLTLGTTGADTVYDLTANTAGFALGNSSSGGVLTLNFGGKSNQTIILVCAVGPACDSGGLNVGVGSSVLVEGGNSTDSVEWVVGSSATLNAGTSFVGNIIAYASVSLLSSVTIGCGSVVAQTGQVSMIGDTISNACTGLSGPSGSTGTPTPVTPTPVTGGATVAVPEGGSTLLYLGFLLVPVVAMRAFYRRHTV